jgi:hypothetical protein
VAQSRSLCHCDKDDSDWFAKKHWIEQHSMADEDCALWGHGSTMLRRISRLPDHVVALLRDKGVEDVVEVEFVTPSGIFPREFRWEALQSSYKAKITVLWLSPTVFVSPLVLCDEHEGEFSFYCSIEFLLQKENIVRRRQQIVEYTQTTVKFLVYSLSSFLEGEVDEPSLLPFQFFRHVTALLPVNYFDGIGLDRIGAHPERCPLDHLLQFLKIVPTGSTQQVVTVACCTTVILNGDGSITQDELRAIVSHPFHPDVKLEFDDYPFSGPVPMIEMLRDVQYLRSIKIPWQVFCVDPDVQEPVFRFSIQSSKLTMSGWCPYSSSLLDTIATFHDVDDIKITSYKSEYAAQQRMLDRCICPFLSGRLRTKHLRVHVFGRLGIRLMTKWAAGVTVPCKSKTLHMFNVWFYPIDDQTPVNLYRIKEWDKEIFPSLVLNYCGEKLIQRPFYEGILPTAIQAINVGMIYHKTTGHHPFDMRVANAGLIYVLLRMAAGDTQGTGGSSINKFPSQCGEAASPPQHLRCSLSGSKRPAT